MHLVAALEGRRRAGLVRQGTGGAVVHAHGDVVALVRARLALDLVPGHGTDDRANRRSRAAAVADFVSHHRTADAAGDRADARAFARDFDFLHLDDHAAVVAGGP